MRKKIAILRHGFIPVYRIEFYRQLNKISDNDYIIFYAPPPSNAGYREMQGKIAFANKKVKNYKISFLGRKIIYQSGVLKILRGSYDAVVLGHEVKFIANIILFLLFKMLGKPVIWWGHGFEKEEYRSLSVPYLNCFIEKLKVWLAQSADMYIVYTARGATILREAGLSADKITIVRNTIDMREQGELYSRYKNKDPRMIREELNLKKDSLVLVYVGRLYKEKRVEELLHLVERINIKKLCRSFVETIIIGGGPEEESLKEIGRDIPGVRFIGKTYNQDLIAKYLRVAYAMIIPGKVGLSVNHAFAHGVPLITRRNKFHAPEVEYIKSGVNGFVVPGDFEEFIQMIVEFLNSPVQQQKFSEAALKTANTLKLSDMVLAFNQAVSLTIERKTHTGVDDRFLVE